MRSADGEPRRPGAPGRIAGGGDGAAGDRGRRDRGRAAGARMIVARAVSLRLDGHAILDGVSLAIARGESSG